MSLEAKIEALTLAVQALTERMIAAKLEAVPISPVAPTAVEPPAPPPPPPVAPTVVMPPVPTFTAPPAAPSAPFVDGKGMIAYVMEAYKAMGPQKGAQIQTVLTGLGYQNINDIKPEHYGALYTGVQALRA